MFQQGAYDGLELTGHDIQGVYADRLMELQNAYSVRWQAPSEDASASFFLSDSSLDGLYAGVSTNFVKQVFLTDNEILNGGGGPIGVLAANYFGIRLRTTDDAMVSGNVLIPLCRSCTLSQIAPGFTGTGIEVLHHAAADTQGSVIEGNSIDYGDVGISAGGSQILVSGNTIAASVPTPTRDAGIGATHPVFANNEVGERLLSAPPLTSAPLADGGTGEGRRGHDPRLHGQARHLHLAPAAAPDPGRTCPHRIGMHGGALHAAAARAGDHGGRRARDDLAGDAADLHL